MTCSTRILSATLALTCASFGCGAGPLTMTTDTLADDGDGETGMGDDGGDGDPGPSACIVDGQLGRALALVDAGAELVHVFEAGGDELVLPASLPVGVDAPASVSATANSSWIAISSSYSIYELPDIIEGAALRLYERETGTLAWAREFDDYRLGSTYVDEQGRIVASVGWSSNPTPSGVVVIDGQVSELSNFGPVGPLGPSNWMPGWIYSDAKETIGSGFYNPFTNELVQITSGYTPPGWQVVGEAIEFIDNDAAVPQLVIAGPASYSAHALAPFAESDSPVYLEARAGDFRLLTTNGPEPDVPGPLVRLELSSGELSTIEVEFPPGLEPFDCYYRRVSIDAEGRVLFELRDAGAAQIHAWDPDATTWTPVGAPMTNIDDVHVAPASGRVLEIHASGPNMTYCVPAEWSEPPAEAVPESSIQLARVEPALSVVLDTDGWGAVSVDDSERCAAWVDSEQGLSVLDLDDFEQLDVGASGYVIWLD